MTFLLQCTITTLDGRGQHLYQTDDTQQMLEALLPLCPSPKG